MSEEPQAAPRPTPPAGWYDYDDRRRWWDGATWGPFEETTNLAETSPPSDQTEGWKEDPLGSGKQRWWDGSQWTTRTGTARSVNVLPGTDPTALTLKSAEERRAALAQRLQYVVNVEHARVENQTDFQAVVCKGKPVNHILHLLISVFTLGLWIPVWIIIAIANGEKRWVITVNDYGQVLG